jgi:hypothetical protein
MERKWCCNIFQDGRNLMWQGLHKILLFRNMCLQIASSWTGLHKILLFRNMCLQIASSWTGLHKILLFRNMCLQIASSWTGLHKILLFRNMCLQIASSWTRSPTNNINFVWKAWNMFSTCIVCFRCCSIAHNMLLVIIDISSMMMTFVNLSFSMTLWGLGRIDKYPCVGMWNAVYTIIIMVLKQSATTFVIVDNNTFLPCTWKCCVMYLMKNILPLLGVPIRMCRPCGFLVIELNTHCYSSLNFIMGMCGWNLCSNGFGIGCIFCSCWMWEIFLVV